jgi:hypothetical protein
MIAETVFAFELVTLAARPVLLVAYTESLAPKSNLAKMLSAWRRRPIGEAERLDLASFLGQAALVIVEQKLSATGKPYAKISGVTAPPEGLVVAAPRFRPFDYRAGDGPIPAAVDSLPYLFGQSLRARIESSPEFRGEKPDQATAAPAPAGTPPADNDTPF